MATDKNGLSADQDKELNTHISELIDAGASDSDIESFTNDYVKKKVATTPSESLSQKLGGGFMPPAKDLEEVAKPLSESGIATKKLVEDTPTYEDKQSLSTTDIANEKKRLEKMPTSESMLLESGSINAISSDIVRNKNISEIASQDPNVLKLNSLILERDKAIQANEGQKVADLSSEIESLKKAPADNPIDLQQQLQQHNLQYQGAPQDTPQEVSGFKPQTLNDRLVANKAKPVKTVGELHDLSNEAQKKVSELQPELDKIKIPFDEQVAQLRKENQFKSTEENGVRKLEGIADAPEAFVMGARNTFKDGLGMLKQVFGTKEDRQNYSDQRALEDGVLFPTETKGGWTSGAEMAGGVAPYMVTGALGGESIVGQILSNGLTMGATGIGSAYHQEYQKQKALGLSKDDADKIALEKSAFHGGTQAVLGGSLPFLGGASKSILMHPKDLKLLEQFAEESALGKPYAYNAKNMKASLKGFASEMGGIQTAFAGEHITNNAFDKYVLGDKKKNLLEGTADVIMQGSLLHLGMHVLPSVPKAIKDIYDVNFSKRYPSIQQAVDMAMQEGKITKEQADAITIPLRQKYVIYNAMPEGLTAEQMVAIKPETEQILELSKKEPSAVENPDVTKDRIAQLQKTIAEKLGTPLTEKEQKSYEKLQEIKADKEDKLTPSEKLELKHYEKRIKTAEDIEFKLAEEKKVAEAETPLTNVGVEEGSGVGGDVALGIQEGYAKKAMDEFINSDDMSYGIYEEGGKTTIALSEAQVRSANGFKGGEKIIPHEHTNIELTKDEKKQLNKIEADKELGFIDGVEYAKQKRNLAKKVFERASNELQQKAVEQSLKETPKAGSVGVGGDVELPNYGKTVDTKMGKVDLVIEPNTQSENKNSIKVSAYDENGNTLGFSSAVIDTKNKTLTVKVSQIKDKYQRNGIYSKIIDEYEAIAKDKGLKLEREVEGETKASKDFWNNREKEGAVQNKINEIAKKFKSVESELKGTIDVEEFSTRLKKRYDEINEQYGEDKANEVLDSEAKRADKIIKEHRDSIAQRLKAEYFKKNGNAPSSIRDFKSGIKSGEYKIDDLPSYKDAVNAGLELPKAVEQSLKETTKEETTTPKGNTSNEGGDYYIKDGKEFKKVDNAKPVKLDTEGDFFAVKNDNGGYTIHEAKSGVAIDANSFHKTIKDAVNNANEKISKNSETLPLSRVIDGEIKRDGLSPRYSQSPKENTAVTDLLNEVNSGKINADDAAIKLDESGVEVSNEVYDQFREAEANFKKGKNGLQVGDAVTVKGKNGNPDFKGNFRGITKEGKYVVIGENGYQNVYEKSDIVEQSIKETPKAETKPEEGSVGVGGDVVKSDTDKDIDLLNSNPKTRSEVEDIVKKVMREDNFKDAIRRIEFLASGALTKHYNNDFSYLKDAAKEIERLSPKQKAAEQSLKETTKAETPTETIQEKGVEEVPKVELPKEVINKFKSLNQPQNEGKNGGTDGINTGKSKNGESGNVGKAKTKKADTSTKNSNAESNEGGEKKKGLKGKGNRIVAKIKGALKHPDYIRALAHEVTDVKDIVLQKFIGGQKINPSTIKELFNNSQGEWNARIGLIDGKAPTIKGLAHEMWEAHKMNFGEETKVSDQDYVNAIEAVIREHNGKKSMVDDINNRFISEDKIDEEHQKWNEYHRNHEQEVVDESAKILEGIDNEELGNKIANAKDDAEVEKYISEIEAKAKQKVDEAIEKYKNGKGEIDSDAIDAIEKEYGKSVAEEVKQSDKFFPFQVEEPTSKRQEMVKDAVQSLIDNGFTKLEQIHQIAKEQLGEGYKKQEIDDAFNAIGKDKVSKEAEPITKGVIGRVSQWLNKTFGGKENVQILGSTKAIMDKAKSLMGGNSNGQPLFMHTPDGKVLGFTHDNKIYLNQEHLNPNTPVHEAGHIWTNWAKENQADHYEKGMDLVNGTDYLAKAKASEFYQKEALKLGKEGSKEYEDYMKHEALAMAIGDKGSKFVTEATRKSFTEWAKELWDSVAKAVGLKDTSAQELQNLTFDELTSRIAKDILSEAPSNYGTSRTIINENRAKLGLGEIGKGKGRTNQETRTVASEIYNQEQANELVDEVLSPDYNKFERTLSANELLVLEEHLRLQELSIKQNDKDRLSIKEKLAKEPDNTEYMGSLAVLESNRQMDIDNKIRTEYAITNAKTATAISLQERGIVTNEHGVLKQLVNGIKDAWGKDIPEWAKEKISDLEKLHSEAVAKIELLNDKYIRGKAEKEIETIKKGAKGKATKEQILERSKQRLAEMIANRNKVEFSVEGDIEKTLDKELFKAIIPDIRELINSKLAEGKLTTLDEISESVANDYKDVIDGVKASDIIDVLGGVYSEKRTKSTLQKQAAELRKQAGEARRLENAQKGIFEKGQPQGEKSETSKEIARLKSIHDAKAKLEDLEKGIIRKTKERGASDPEVVALQKQAAELRKQVINNSPELSSEQLFKKALAIERQIKEGNFNKSVEERKKFESNEDWIKANRSLANARNQLNELKRDALNSNKTKIMKLEDWVTRFGRNMIFIGNFATFAKLAFASSQGFVLRPIQESVIGKITKKAFPFLADKAPVEGTLENDYKQFYGDFLSPRQLWATIRDVSKSSTTELSKKNDPYVDESINMADFLSDDIKAKYPNAERVLRTTSHIGNRIIDMSSAGWHQIVKDPIKRATYNASFGNIMKYYADHNLNYNDPMLIEQAEQIAWIRAKQEIFLEGNAWGGSLKEYAQKQKKIALEMVRLGKENPALKKEWKANWEYTKGAIADVLVPIATVPANIARRSAMANPVSLVSSIAEAKKMNNIIKESLGEVTNEEADAIILKIKQRSIGSALFILGGLAGAGWLGKKYSAGGLYSPFYPDWKRDKDEPVSNELNIAGEEVPHSMQHITLFTTYQMAATFGVMFNHFYEKEMKDNSNRAEYLNILMAVLDAGLATGGAIAGTVPTYGKVQSVAAGFATGKMDKVFRDTKKQFGVQKISGALDYTGILNYSKDELDAQELEKKRNKEKEDSSKERHDNMRKAN